MSWMTEELAFLAALALLAHSVVGLLAIWVGLGQGHWFFRVAVLGGVLALGLPIPAYDLVFIFLVQSAAVIVTLAIVRRYFIRTAAKQLNLSKKPPPHGRSQYSLLDLLLATVVVAAIAAFVAKLPSDVEHLLKFYRLIPLFVSPWASLIWPIEWTPSGPWTIFGTLGGAFALSTLAAAAVVLSGQRLWVRLLLLVLIPASALMAAWLVLARASGWLAVGRRAEESPSDQPIPKGHVRPVVRYAARFGVFALAVLVLLPLAAVYRELAFPLPLPEVVASGENGYPDLVRAGENITLSAVPDDRASAAQLRAFVTQHRQVLDAARAALNEDCRVPVRYSRDEDDRQLREYYAIRSLYRSLSAEGKLADMEGRTADAVAHHLDLIRLGQATARDGLLIDFLTGSAAEGMGLNGLGRIRKKLTPAQSRTLIAALRRLETTREPVEHAIARDVAWGQHVLGWQWRLWFVFQKLRGGWDVVEKVQFNYHVRQALTRLLICDLAVESYRSEHGQAPERLVDLVPEYLPKGVPEDPFGGRALRYHRTSAGYVLYSVGPDGRDDGGKPNEPWYDPEGRGDILLDYWP
ncbi:MAG: hypothetical protein ACYTG0_15530 [Planctomycetota bacterium]|jgi:hypothetical protein